MVSWRNLKKAFLLYKRIKRFPSTISGRNLKSQQSRVILEFCLKKTRSEKSHDYRDHIAFKKLRFQNVFPSHENWKTRRFLIPPV